MAMKNLSQLRDLFKEPQLMHKWSIEVPAWPKAIAPSNPDIAFLVTTSSLPDPEWEDAVVELGGFKLQYNGKENRNGKVDWKFFENTDSDVIKYFFIDYANKRQGTNTLTDINMESSKNVDLIAPVVNMNLYAADGKTVTKRIQLINCLFKPTSFGGEFGQEGNVVQQPTIEVTFDSFLWIKV